MLRFYGGWGFGYQLSTMGPASFGALPSTPRASVPHSTCIHTSLSPRLLQTARPVAVLSAAPTLSRELIMAISTSRGKSFVLRKCVSALRLLTQRAASALSRATRRRLALGAGSIVAHPDQPPSGLAAERARGGQYTCSTCGPRWRAICVHQNVHLARDEGDDRFSKLALG